MTRLQKNAARRWTGCIVLFLYLFTLFSARIHLLTEIHLNADFLAPLHTPSAFERDHHHDDGDHEHHPHPASDHEALLASVSKATVFDSQDSTPVLSPVVFCAFVESSVVSQIKIDTPGLSPPELVRTWQFSFRAALPARAPSFIS